MINNVAVIGTGVIGASWATHFLMRGMSVVASDPADGAEERLRSLVAEQWRIGSQLGVAQEASLDRLSFEKDPQRAAEDAGFVQENGPERIELKHELFRRLDEATKPDVILASSSSGLKASDIQAACMHPERVLIGHPFNPPHLIPLVEVVGGRKTSSDAIERAMSFYREIGKVPIHVKKEMMGHVTNRLQAALWREAYGLVGFGAATVEDIDLAISNGPGLRWALLGPFLNQQLSGGDGGMKHLLDHLGPPMDEWWQDLFETRLTDSLKSTIVRGSQAETEGWDMPVVVKERDDLLVKLIRQKAASPAIP